MTDAIETRAVHAAADEDSRRAFLALAHLLVVGQATTGMTMAAVSRLSRYSRTVLYDHLITGLPPSHRMLNRIAGSYRRRCVAQFLPIDAPMSPLVPHASVDQVHAIGSPTWVHAAFRRVPGDLRLREQSGTDSCEIASPAWVTSTVTSMEQHQASAIAHLLGHGLVVRGWPSRRSARWSAARDRRFTLLSNAGPCRCG